MTDRFMSAAAMAGVLALMLGFAAAPAHALSMKECSAKYHDAKQAGTLNGLDWKAFRAAQCGSSTTASPAVAGAATTASATSPSTPSVAAPAVAAPADAPATTMTPPASRKKEAAATVPDTGNTTFPTAVDSKFAKLSAGKARMQTCLEQYHTNKTSGGNGGLKWVQKGGGYYSECNKRLKQG